MGDGRGERIVHFWSMTNYDVWAIEKLLEYVIKHDDEEYEHDTIDRLQAVEHACGMVRTLAAEQAPGFTKRLMEKLGWRFLD